MLSTLRAAFPPTSPTYNLLSHLLSTPTAHPISTTLVLLLLPPLLSLCTITYIHLHNPTLAPDLHRAWNTRSTTHLFLTLTLEYFVCILLGLWSVVVFGGMLGWGGDWVLFWAGECCGKEAGMVVVAGLVVLGCAAFVVVWGWARPVCGVEDEERCGDVEGAEIGRERDEVLVCEAITGDEVFFMLEKKE